MRRRVPLTAVRAFEAAARYKSLARAADELCVTPTAISHQVRLLEDFLQIKLFDRHNGRLDLTLEAKSCIAELTAGLDCIDDALGTILNNDRRERIVVGASPSVTALWLLPRLQRFVASVPAVDIILKTLDTRSNLANEDLDISICNWDTGVDQRVEPLMDEEIIPVCAPQLVSDKRSMAQNLCELPLIHDDKRAPSASGFFPTWQRYFSECGISRPDVGKGVRCTQSSLAVEAAIEGYGMLLGRTKLIGQAIEDGRLVSVADPYPIRFQYYMVSPWKAQSPTGEAFRDWLISEAHTDQTPPGVVV